MFKLENKKSLVKTLYRNSISRNALFALLACVIGFSGCKKDETTNPPPTQPEALKPKTIKFTLNETPRSNPDCYTTSVDNQLVYHSNGYVSKILRTAYLTGTSGTCLPIDRDSVTFTYNTANKLESLTIDVGPVYKISLSYSADGKVERYLIHRLDAQEADVSYKMTYQGDGATLTNEINPLDFTIIQTANGNITKVAATISQKGNDTFDSYDAKTNALKNILPLDAVSGYVISSLPIFQGKSGRDYLNLIISSNNPLKRTIKRSNITALQYSIPFTYTYNDKDYPTSIKTEFQLPYQDDGVTTKYRTLKATYDITY